MITLAAAVAVAGSLATPAGASGGKAPVISSVQTTTRDVARNELGLQVRFGTRGTSFGYRVNVGLTKAANAKGAWSPVSAVSAPAVRSGSIMLDFLLRHLQPDTLYYVVVQARNRFGTATSPPFAARTMGQAIPEPTVGPVHVTSATTATLSGTVTPTVAGSPYTYGFSYGLTADELTHHARGGSGTAPAVLPATVVLPGARITGLKPHTRYYYQLAVREDQTRANETRDLPAYSGFGSFVTRSATRAR